MKQTLAEVVFKENSVFEETKMTYIALVIIFVIKVKGSTLKGFPVDNILVK